MRTLSQKLSGEITPLKGAEITVHIADEAGFFPAPKEAEVAAPIAAPTGTIDASSVVDLLLRDKRSEATRRAYEADLRHFFAASGAEYGPAAISAFLALVPSAVAARLAIYKAHMLGKGLAEATVNRRLSAIRALLRFAFRLGLSQTDGARLVDSERAHTYRDTKGIDLKLMKKLQELPGTDTIQGLRDTAILRLLMELALRRAEVCSLRVEDFSAREKRLQVLGKGRGSQREPLTLSAKSASAITAYVLAAGHGGDSTGPLFRNLVRRPSERGHGLTPDGLHDIVHKYGVKLGVPKLAPHKLRHSSITCALDATGGDIRKVRVFARHANVNTTIRYDDKRADGQGEVTGILSKLL